jgi:hypothetical protein
MRGVLHSLLAGRVQSFSSAPETPDDDHGGKTIQESVQLHKERALEESSK